MKTNRHKKNGERTVCYAGFFMELIIIALCYGLATARWTGAYSTAAIAMIQSGIILLILILTSLLICIFFRSQSVERKLLFMIGCIVVSLGVLGYSELVMQNKLTYLDATYRSLQFFIGEFDAGIFTNSFIPPLINVARFLGLAVTFGTIVIILLKEKIHHWNIRLFYKDIVIITDRPDTYIIDLAGKYLEDNRKVVIGYTASEGNADKAIGKDISSVNIDIHKDVTAGLDICNVKKAQNIYLLCEKTEDNVKLAKAVYAMFGEIMDSNNVKTVKTDALEKPKSIDGLIRYYCALIVREPKRNTLPIQSERNKTICYIQYQTDEEREYYSIDEAFTNRLDNFDTYFINTYDIAIRQMLTKISIKESFDLNGKNTMEALKEKLGDIRIAVAGSGAMLERTLFEIAKNCVYNVQTPMKIFHIAGQGEEAYTPPAPLCEIIELETLTAEQIKGKMEILNLLFISAMDEIEVRTILQNVFQYDLQEKIRECLILTKGNAIEYDILLKYINTLLNPYRAGEKRLEKTTTIHISTIANLMPTIERFYRAFGPTSKEIHAAYNKAIVNDELQNFNNLPEIYIESNILSALHNSFIMEIVNTAIHEQSNGRSCTALVRALLEYLAATEHERWYNERRIQGCMYSKEQSHITHKNPNLLHWDQLSEKQKEDNIKYVIGALIAQREKSIGMNYDDVYKNQIQSYTIIGQ